MEIMPESYGPKLANHYMDTDIFDDLAKHSNAYKKIGAQLNTVKAALQDDI